MIVIFLAQLMLVTTMAHSHQREKTCNADFFFVVFYILTQKFIPQVFTLSMYFIIIHKKAM